MHTHFAAAAVSAGIAIIALAARVCGAGAAPLAAIKLPPGFKIEIYADDLPGARSMARSPSGVLYVGTRSEGVVYALVDRNRDRKADETIIIARGLNSPNGVAFKDGSLYVAEIDRILRYDDIEKDLARPPAPAVLAAAFPKDRHHGWKFIRFGPDGLLYVPVGAPCNVCERKEKLYASIARLDPAGEKIEIVAEGVRNTVGFDWHPGTKELWFTDNGRDWLGDDAPPDELNRAPKTGLHFGFPYVHGAAVRDPRYGDGRDLSGYTAPAMELGAHVAALGMRFYTGAMFPPEYRNRVFIAEHGSWNRTSPSGYRITSVEIRDGKAVNYKVFAEGWLKGFRAWGRPVDLEILPDGSMLVSDDKRGAVYRISRER